MVFEQIVTDLLNRFLGDFVENLDSSQLKVGIWGGDVKLENLEVKETALDDFDLPVKLKFGYLQSLVLKIPWKNLYNEPVIANIDGLHLIAVPNKGVVYNEEKAKKNAADIKQKTLARLEEARKNRRKPADPQADTFAEKMITQIIKNLQVSISNIHVRYEDKYTNRHRPFVAGVTLHTLDFQTTDENWKHTIHKETVKVIHKLVSLKHLAVYWNSDSKLFSDLTDKKQIRRELEATINNGKNKPPGYRYILEPITMEAKLKLNQKPETDGTNWKTPKIDLGVDMETLALAIGKLQYQDVLLFLEAQERFNLAGQYLKYRPNLNEYKGHYKTWWKFAYNAILEEKVRRRRNNWSWNRMKAHRNLVRKYKNSWIHHQTDKNLSAEDKATIEEAESKLDVFNVNVARQQAEMEIDRQGLTRLEDQPQGWVAWGKSWFGGGGGAQKAKPEKDIASKFQEAMTPEEKAKLFEAIDYQENIPPTNYPKEFIENKLDFQLKQVAVIVEGAVTLQLLHLRAAIEQRPSASAMKLASSIQELRMDGCGAEMLRVRDISRDWLSLFVETNPIHGQYDQKVQLAIAPVNLKYHAPAVNNSIEVFKPPESVKLNQLTALAMSRYEEVKARSVTGLAHAVENKSKLVLDIQIEPATLMVSEGGIYNPSKATILADLGLLTIRSVETETAEGADKMATLVEKVYDKFRVKLDNVVISMAENFELAKGAIKLKESPLHILKPTGLDIQIHKSCVDDLKFPKMKIIGDLPDIVIGISDVRLLLLLRLLNSIPKPEAEPVVVVEEHAPASSMKLKDRAKMKTIMETEEVDDVIEKTQAPPVEKTKTSEQQVQIELDLRLNQIGLELLRGDEILLDVSIVRMACKLQMRTFDMTVLAALGAVRVSLPTFKSLANDGTPLYLIDNKEADGVLMKLKFVQANPESPFFATEYQMTEQMVEFEFSQLNVYLHQEGLMELKRFGEDLQARMALQDKQQKKKSIIANAEDAAEIAAGAGRKISRAISHSVESLAAMAKASQTSAALSKARKDRQLQEADPNIVKMRVLATVGRLTMVMGSAKNGLETKFSIKNVISKVKMTLKAMDVEASLQAITIQDCTKDALYKKLLAVHGEKEMLRFEMTQYQRSEAEKNAMQPSDIDMKVKVRLAQMRFVFLNLWVARTMAWLSPFQEEAQKAAAAAQQVAAEKAAEAAQNVKQIMESSPPRIELDVKLMAPVIVVPRKSNSQDVLLAVLGTVKVNNKITGHKDNKKAVIDRMQIELSEMTLGIGRINEAVNEVSSSCEILKPLSFSITCHRNLTFGFVKDIPETIVDAHIPSIEMTMSEQDYTTIMLTLSGNLAEGQKEEIPPISTTSTATTTTTDVDSISTTSEASEVEEQVGKKKSVARTAVASPSQKDRVADASDYEKLVFQFTLDKIVAVLYSGGTNHGEKRNASDAFAGMRLEGLSLNGMIKEDTTLKVSMKLNAFTMRDERIGKTKIPCLMDKKEGHQNDLFLDLQFSQNSQQDKNAVVKMSAFFICLCPEFLGCLARFFAVPPEDEDVQTAREAKKEGTGGTGATATEVAKPTTPPVPGQPPQQTPAGGTMTIDCDMRGVEVILIENSMEPETTQALILSFNVKLDATPSGKISRMQGGVEDLKIYSTYYNKDKRDNNRDAYKVLEPMQIAIKATMDAHSKGCDAELRMSPMVVRMSPAIIRLLSAVNAEFAKSSAVDKSTSVSVPKRKTYPDYWRSRPIEKKKWWFLTLPIEEEGKEMEEDTDISLPMAPPETAKVIIEAISFKLEAGTGKKPIPLIYFDMMLSADAANWSSALVASADLTMEMEYYNEAFRVWEPVIEKVENEQGGFDRWHAKLNVKGRDKLNPADKSPNMDVKIEAEKMLNITVTKSFLQLLNQISEVMAQAAKQITPPSVHRIDSHAPFVLLNETGMVIRAADSDTIRVQPAGGSGSVDATHGAFVDLYPKEFDGSTRDQPSSSTSTAMSLRPSEGDSKPAILRLELEDTVRELAIGRAEKRALRLPKRSEAGKQWKVIAETTIEDIQRLVTLTSHIRVHNHLDVMMEVYVHMRDESTSVQLCGQLQPGETYSLPVPTLYTPTGELFFLPKTDKCEMSDSITWHNFEAEPDKRQMLFCPFSDPESVGGVYFEAVVVTEDVTETADIQTPLHTIHLYHPLEFHNNLPIPVKFDSPLDIELSPGESTKLNLASGQKLKLALTHLDSDFLLDMEIPREKENLQVVALNTETGSDELLLGLNWSNEHGDQKVYLYAPFWLVNNTSRTLQHSEVGGGFISKARGCVSCHKNVPVEESEFTVQQREDVNPMLLPFPCADLTKKKKARVQIYNGNNDGDNHYSDFSDEIPLDVVGNASRIVCKGKERDYELTVDIKLCQSGLTKIVTFSPFYLVSNLSKFDMEVKELGTEQWYKIPAETCVGIYPISREKKKLLCARYVGSTEETIAFPITENIETLCEISGETVGIDVSVATGESKVAIHLSSFAPGMAPACIMNTLKYDVTFWQKGHSKENSPVLRRNEMAFFTWSDVTKASDRVMEIKVGNWTHEDQLDRNRVVDFRPSGGNEGRFYYMANFLVGLQRIILFADDPDIVKNAYGSWETDVVDMQAELSLQGIGLSIVDNLAGKEILYIGISSSDILWEEEVKKGRFKPLAVKYMEAIEQQYQHHLITPNHDYQVIDNNFEVNLEHMISKRKKGKEYRLRRTFERGIWVQFGQSLTRKQVHFKLNHLQIDNQLDACIFPRVLAVVPPPKSIVADNAPKPFVEMSLLQRMPEHSTVFEIEYASILIQEFAVQVDIGLLNALMQLFAGQVASKPYGKEMFDQDLEMANQKLEDTAKLYKTQSPKNFYNMLHISPLMIHLSFSQSGMSPNEGGGGIGIQSEFVNVLLKSVGVTLTELQDVVFKLAYFERRCTFYSSEQLNAEIVNHYVTQFLKQFYVVVLGLDIIGNPFGLVRDLSAGVEDLFYQPFQGAIQGPEEFAQGVALGVQSMFGHAVGGAAGAVGRITGTVGKGVAALTFDDDYQRKRQEDLNRRPKTVGEGMARGFKGLGMGIVDGLKGVVTKPIEGAQQEGAKGLFKGVGKGLIGVVTRPVSGVVDFASSTMDTVRTVAGSNRDAGALRPPRVIRSDKIIRPFSRSEAIGFRTFKDTERGALAETDQFITHAPIAEKIVLLVTNRQLVVVKRTDLMGTWGIEWQTEYSKIQEPQFIDNGIKILFKEKKKGFLGMGSSEGKIITFKNAEAIRLKIKQAYEDAMK